MRHHNKGINKTGGNTAAQHTANHIRGYKRSHLSYGSAAIAERT